MKARALAGSYPRAALHRKLMAQLSCSSSIHASEWLGNVLEKPSLRFVFKKQLFARKLSSPKKCSKVHGEIFTKQSFAFRASSQTHTNRSHWGSRLPKIQCLIFMSTKEENMIFPNNSLAAVPTTHPLIIQSTCWLDFSWVTVFIYCKRGCVPYSTKVDNNWAYPMTKGHTIKGLIYSVNIRLTKLENITGLMKVLSILTRRSTTAGADRSREVNPLRDGAESSGEIVVGKAGCAWRTAASWDSRWSVSNNRSNLSFRTWHCNQRNMSPRVSLLVEITIFLYGRTVTKKQQQIHNGNLHFTISRQKRNTHG